MAAENCCRSSEHSAARSRGTGYTGAWDGSADGRSWSRKLRVGRAVRRLLADRRGTAVIELALALPILTVFLFGIVSGGCWLAMSHIVQESANQGARAAIAGITAAERASLASDGALLTLTRSYGIRSDEVAVRVDDDGRQLTVKVAYDGSGNPLLKLPIMPAATATIRRQASVLLAGY